MLVFDWFGNDGVKKIIDLLYLAMNIIRYVVPIGLVVMTSIDIFRKVLNPEDKDAQKKIIGRAIAAIIVFFVPTIVNLIMKLVDIGRDGDVPKSPIKQPAQPVKDTKNDKPEENKKISVIKIDCPKDTYKVGDKVSITATGNNNYQGDFVFNLLGGENEVKLINPKSRSVTLEILSYPKNGSITIAASAEGVRDECNIKIQNNELKLSDISINCPLDAQSVGSRLTINAIGNNGYDGDFNFRIVGDDRYARLSNKAGKQVLMEISSRPKNGIITLEASAQGVTKTCDIKVKEKLQSISLKCPSNIYKVGEKVEISATGNGDYDGEFEFKIINDSLAAKLSNDLGKKTSLEIISYPTNGFITVEASSGNVKNTCNIQVKKGTVKINSCPSQNVFNIGDTASLSAKSDNAFDRITWQTSNDNIVSKVENNDGQSLLLNIKGYNPGTILYVYASSSNGGTDFCTIKIHPSENVGGAFKLINCPYKVQKVGSTFTLQSPYPIRNWVTPNDDLELLNKTENSVTVRVKKHFSDLIRINILGRTFDEKDAYCWIYTSE